MKRPNITPGEWTLVPCPENTWNVSGFIHTKEGDIETATAMTKGKENALAIAAVPALLSALEKFMTHAQDIADALHEQGHHPDTANQIIDSVYAALTAAGYTFD
jgi:hypothetical protein